MTAARPAGIHGLLFYAVVAALPVSAALFKVWVCQDAVRLGYALTSEEHRAAALSDMRQKLAVEVAATRSPAQLLVRAKELGLTVPAPLQLFAGRGAEAPRLAQATPVVRAAQSAQGADHAGP